MLEIAQVFARRMASPAPRVAACAIGGAAAVGAPLIAVGSPWGSAAFFASMALALVAAGLSATLALVGQRGAIDLAATTAQRIADGEVRDPIPPMPGAAEALFRALETLRQTTMKIAGDVRGGTLAIAASANNIMNDQQVFSAMVRTQAESLDQTAAALEQLTATVEQTADNARRSQEMAVRARTLATDGGAAMQEVVATMGTIRSSSAKMSDIISVIDGIAFQTNILALNAAVEAARAGEQGRGFAVVAGEVRTLATRSAEAAKAVKGLIAESVDAVKSGAAHVDRAGSTMREVVGSVGSVADMIAEMSAAAREQSAGIAEINRAMAEIDSATKRNTEVVDRAGEPVQALQKSAVALTDLVAHIKIGETKFAAHDEAVELVRRAVQFVKQHGPRALCDDVNKLDKGQFIDRDLYLSLYGVDGTVPAHGTNPRFVGTDWRNFKDVEGKLFVSDIVRASHTQPSGDVIYKMNHPTTQKILTKKAHYERVGDLIITCGSYVDG